MYNKYIERKILKFMNKSKKIFWSICIFGFLACTISPIIFFVTNEIDNDFQRKMRLITCFSISSKKDTISIMNNKYCEIAFKYDFKELKKFCDHVGKSDVATFEIEFYDEQAKKIDNKSIIDESWITDHIIGSVFEDSVFTHACRIKFKSTSKEKELVKKIKKCKITLTFINKNNNEKFNLTQEYDNIHHHTHS